MQAARFTSTEAGSSVPNDSTYRTPVLPNGRTTTRPRDLARLGRFRCLPERNGVLARARRKLTMSWCRCRCARRHVHLLTRPQRS